MLYILIGNLIKYARIQISLIEMEADSKKKPELGNLYIYIIVQELVSNCLKSPTHGMYIQKQGTSNSLLFQS